MPPDSVADLVAVIQQARLLETPQFQQLTTSLQPRYRNPRSLARDLVQRGMLTAFQVNRLLQGQGQELLLGSYVLLERLGEGGMGQVFKARNWKLGRVVALKLIRKERLRGTDAVRRFRREIQAAAQLDHVHIIRALDADEVAGHHFLVMEYIEGHDLSKHLKQHGPPSVMKTCEYMRQAALALAHAHERGLIHRDVKPSNLLLTADGLTIKLLDLGLARLDSTTEESGSLTATGAVMGTPDYIAPEQALNSRHIDGRSDLYSLGCTFYHLLTGQAPFPGEVLTEKLLKHQMDQPEPIQILRPEVPEAVVLVVNKLLAKKPENRYPTGQALAADLSVLLGRTPPSASTVALPDPFSGLTETPTETLPPASPALAVPSHSSVLSRRTVLTSVAIALAGLVLFTLAMLLVRPREKAPDAQQTTGKSVTLATSPGIHPLGALRAADIPAQERFAWQPAQLVAVLGEHRGRHDQVLQQVAVNVNGKRLVTRDSENTLQIWNGTTLERTTTARIQGYHFLLAPDGNTLAVEMRSPARTMLWDLTGSEPRQGVQLPDSFPLAFSPDSKRLATRATLEEGKLHLWDLQGAQATRGRTLTGPARGAAFGPCGRFLAVHDRGVEDLRVWDLTSPEPTFRAVVLPETYPEKCPLIYSDDGQTVGILQHQNADFWDLYNVNPAAPLTRVRSLYRSLTISPDGRSVVWLEGSRLWRQYLRLAAVPAVWASAISGSALAFSADGRTLVLVDDHTLRPWDVGGSEPRELAAPRGPTRPVRALGFLPDGKTLVTLAATPRGKGSLWFWDLAKRQARLEVPLAPDLDRLAISPDGNSLVVAGKAGVHRHDTASGQELHQFTAKVDAITFDPAGLLLAGGNTISRATLVWDLLGRVKLKLTTGYIGSGSLAYSPDGTQIASSLAIFNARTGERELILSGSGPVAFRPPLGKQIVVGNRTGTQIQITDVATEMVLRSWSPMASFLFFSPDGGLLAQCNDNTVTVVDPDTGKRLHDWKFPWRVHEVAFAPDGRHLALANANGTVYLLRLERTAIPGS